MSVLIDKDLDSTMNYIKNFDYTKNISDSIKLIISTTANNKVIMHNYVKDNYFLDILTIETCTLKNYIIKYYKKVSY